MGRASVWGMFCIVILAILQEQLPMYAFHVKFSHSLNPLRDVACVGGHKPPGWCRMRTSSRRPLTDPCRYCRTVLCSPPRNCLWAHRWALPTACLPGVSDKPVAFLILVRGNLVKRLPEYTNEGHRFAFVIELPESHSTRFPKTWKDMERREYETYGVKPFFDVLRARH
jgi:hypothetical protein